METVDDVCAEVGERVEVSPNFSLVSYSVKQVRDQPQGFWGRVCVCVCTQSQSHSWLFCNPMEHSPPGSSVPEISPSQHTGVVLPFPSPWDLPPAQGLTCVSCIGWGFFIARESSGGPERSWLSPFKFVLSFKSQLTKFHFLNFSHPNPSQT